MAVAGPSLEAEVGLVMEEFVQKLERVTHAHLEASRAQQAKRDVALDERERELSERERAFEERSKLLERHASVREALELEKAEALKQVLPEQNVKAETEQAMLKSQQPDRAKAALMVPSPTRARSNIPLPTSSAMSTPKPVRTEPFSSPPPRSAGLAGVPPVPPCSPPVATPVAIVTSQGVSASPQAEEGNVARKVSMIFERKEKLLMALSNTGGFQSQANSTAGDDSVNNSVIMNSSMVSTPGRNSNFGGAAPATSNVPRRSLAELLQDDEARLEVLRTKH